MSHVLDAVIRELADVGWRGFQAINTRVPESPSPSPDWAPGPLLRAASARSPARLAARDRLAAARDASFDTRNAILNGERDLADLARRPHGRDQGAHRRGERQLIIRKTCREHGTFEDLLLIDPEFSRLIEQRYPGRDFRTLGDEPVHRHGTSTIKYGRGAVLTIDLTNRCNMMCNPCFMDAEPGRLRPRARARRDQRDSRRLDLVQAAPADDRAVLGRRADDVAALPRGVPLREGRRLLSVQAATNGLRFALEPEFAQQAKEAGFRPRLLPVRRRDERRERPPPHLESLRREAEGDRRHARRRHRHPPGHDGREQRERRSGRADPRLCDRNSDKMGGVSFQPVSFTGRDEEISDEDRRRQRYTISHLAHDLARHTNGKVDAYRDWFPLGAMGALSALADHVRSLKGPEGPNLGSLACSCHPNCGSSILVIANRNDTGVWSKSCAQCSTRRRFLRFAITKDRPTAPWWHEQARLPMSALGPLQGAHVVGERRSAPVRRAGTSRVTGRPCRSCGARGRAPSGDRVALATAVLDLISSPR